MFDWNDEELANIIWGEAGESDDCIVPYPEADEEKPPGLYQEGSEKELDQEAGNIKSIEQRKSVTKTDFHGGKLQSNGLHNSSKGRSPAGIGMNPCPCLSLSNPAQTNQDSVGMEVSKKSTAISKCNSSRDDKTQLDNDSETFQNQHGDREQGDFVDNGWANIGSFDDLERIFSDSDPLFGHVTLGNVDELWSASKDVTSMPEKSFPLSIDSPNLGLEPLRNTSEQFEIKTEYMLDQDQSFNAGYGKINDPTSHPAWNVEACTDDIEYAGGTSKILVKEKTALEMVGNTPPFDSLLDCVTAITPVESADKVNWQSKLLKIGKQSIGKTEGRQLQDLCGTWSPYRNQFQQFDGRFTPPVAQTCPSLVLSQQRQLQGPESPHYHHFSNTLSAPSLYGNMTNQYASMPGSPKFHCGKDNQQPVLSGYVSPGNSNLFNNSPDAHMKPLIMTPQEKIEKLRRRQQMRAMLAIQRQKQQLNHQGPCTDHSISQTNLLENQMQLMEGGNIKLEENPNSVHSLDPNSHLEQDDSNTVSIAIDDCSMEDTILNRLQDIVAKLDIRVRICIRDSLFRLAQSAMQRHYMCDTSSTNRSNRDKLEVSTKEEINSHNKFARSPDVETKTNPIDRNIAHLLFHRPLDLSGKHPETPESPECTKSNSGLMSLPMGYLPESSKHKPNLSHTGSKISCLCVGGDHSKNSPCIESSEQASNNKPADVVAMEIEASP